MSPERKLSIDQTEALTPVAVIEDFSVQSNPDVSSPDKRAEKERLVESTYNNLARRLESVENFEFGDTEKAILRLKLEWYFQREENVDVNTLFDAIIETPNFIQTKKGGFHRLLKIHKQINLLAMSFLSVLKCILMSCGEKVERFRSVC